MSKRTNAIPPITNPCRHCGPVWKQPSLSDIEVDATHALMTQETFDEINDFDESNPTCAYEGKMWKRDLHPNTPDSEWMLYWFVKAGPSWDDRLYISYRSILIA